jgi:hypothetical protein
MMIVAMVFLVGLASQARAAEWRVGGAALSKVAKSETIAGSGPLSFVSKGGFVFNSCSTESSGTILPGGTGELSVKFSGCHNEVCSVKPFTVPMKITLSGVYVQAAPPSGTTFTNLIFEKDEEEICLFGGTSWPLTGTTAAEIDEPGLESVEYPLRFSSTISSLGKTSMSFISKPTNFEGTLKLALSGPNKGKVWGVETTPTTKLCKAKAGECEPYKLGTAISGALEEGTKEGVKFVFTYKGEKLEPSCLASSLKGSSTNQGTPQTGQITALEFSECGGGLCTIAGQGFPWSWSVEALTEGNGTMSWTPTFKIKCLSMAEECVYSAEKAMTFSLTGGAPAKLSSAGVGLKAAGGGKECGASGAKWEGVAAAGGVIKYKITAPSPLFVRLL